MIFEQKTDQELFLEYQKERNELVRNEIIERNLYIAEILAKKMAGRGVDFDDLYQVASLALIGAVERFDPSKGLKFSTFATPSILGEIKNYFRDKSRTIRMGRAKNQIAIDIKRCIAALTTKLARNPSYQEIADELKIELEQVIEIMEFQKGVLSLDCKIDEGETELYEVIADHEDRYQKADNQLDLKDAIRELDEKEQRVIKLRFFEDLSQTEVAKRMNVSQMFVSRVERKVIEKLRKSLVSG